MRGTPKKLAFFGDPDAPLFRHALLPIRATHASPLRRKPGATERKTRCGDRPGLRHSSQGCLFLLEPVTLSRDFSGIFRISGPSRPGPSKRRMEHAKERRRTVVRIRKRLSRLGRAVRSSRMSLRSCGLRGMTGVLTKKTKRYSTERYGM